MQNSNIKVSVCVVTYNQEKYIGECLESLVTQKTDFPFEIIVGDDASTDNTPNIILEYQKKYPDIIIPILRQENLGPVRNIVDIYKRATGKYIAHLDGDDMVFSGKLQIQADTLDANPDCIICSHGVVLYDNTLVTSKTYRQRSSGKYTLLDLYKDLPFFTHSSKMFRNNQEKDFWSQFSETALDITVHIAQAKKGKIYHIQEIYGIYRINTGVSINNNRLNPNFALELDNIFNSALISNDIDHHLIRKLHAQAYFKMAYQSALLKNKKDLLRYIEKSISICRYSMLQNIFFYLRKVPIIVIFLCNIRVKLKKIF